MVVVLQKASGLRRYRIGVVGMGFRAIEPDCVVFIGPSAMCWASGQNFAVNKGEIHMKGKTTRCYVLQMSLVWLSSIETHIVRLASHIVHRQIGRLYKGPLKLGFHEPGSSGNPFIAV